MKLTEKELNGLIKEAINRTFKRIVKEYKQERQKSRHDAFFEGEQMEQVKKYLETAGWELAYLFKMNPETKEVKYFVTPIEKEAKGEWATCVGRIGMIFKQTGVKQGAVKKEVIDAKAKKSKKYDPSADEKKEKTGAHWFILKRTDVDWDKITAKFVD